MFADQIIYSLTNHFSFKGKIDSYLHLFLLLQCVCVFCYGSDIENTRENLWFYAHLLLDSRSKQSWVGWAIIFILLHPIVLCSRNFLHQLLALSHTTPSCDNPVDYNQRKVLFLFCSKLISTCLCLFFFLQCTPIVGHGFVLDKYKCQCRRGFYHPSRVALNGFKSRLQSSL